MDLSWACRVRVHILFFFLKKGNNPNPLPHTSAHVHLNDPGRTAWEGFTTGTLAAASGGVTTLIDMPLNSIPPTTSIKNLKTKRDVASGKCWVDVGFWGGVVPGNEVCMVESVCVDGDDNYFLLFCRRS